ncbi:conserved hypothetical protein [Pediculus humanus corporis]|uniref:RNA-binding region-containing protein 3 n=1 Tax=Pediculus humanus subsp. corporis TaxID=121224 RepID=E0VLT7_PEDHC|nr:uncharacterized protein Phum_PHUM293630 [Pediculus humanus corporis]EEB14343.1 conserved hypothetical protein [Pediculus humanus corporis]
MHNLDTLLIKHLPNDFNDEEKEKFLKYFGAKEVKCISSKRKKYNIAFARFESIDAAKSVIHRLHQINIFGNFLSVEYAKDNKINFANNESKIEADNNENKENEKYYQQFIDKLTSWHSNVNFKQPVPCHLKYQYPAPDKQALTNILKMLITVPKFYTQVLHLMNKMNLPCPFGDDILPNVKLDVDPFYNENKEKEVKTTSESEISSDEEVKDKKELIPKSFKVKKKSKINISKPLKIPPPVVQKTKKTLFEEVFEKPYPEKETKKLKLSNITLISDQINQPGKTSSSESETTVGFAKTVTDSDLRYIYNKYLTPDTLNELNMYVKHFSLLSF